LGADLAYVSLAATTTILLLVVGVPLAAWLAATKIKIKPLIEAIISMPLVLPPSVLGFYFLLTFSPASALGQFLEKKPWSSSYLFVRRLGSGFDGI
jgi:molybdate transport system permease protein